MSHKVQILLVEDYPVIQELYGEALKKHGFDVDIANDGSVALDMCKTKDYDFILLDLLLPQVSGVDFLERFKKKDEKTHVIILSDFAYPNTVEKAFKLGASSYWIKAENTPTQLVDKLVNYKGPNKQAVVD